MNNTENLNQGHVLEKSKQVEKEIAKHRKLLNRAVGNQIIPHINFHHYEIVRLIEERQSLTLRLSEIMFGGGVIGLSAEAKNSFQEQYLKIEDEAILSGSFKNHSYGRNMDIDLKNGNADKAFFQTFTSPDNPDSHMDIHIGVSDKKIVDIYKNKIDNRVYSEGNNFRESLQDEMRMLLGADLWRRIKEMFESDGIDYVADKDYIRIGQLPSGENTLFYKERPYCYWDESDISHKDSCNKYTIKAEIKLIKL